jgi:hypothetical protein
MFGIEVNKSVFEENIDLWSLKVLMGFAYVLDGLVVLLSVGLLTSKFAYKVAKYMAVYRYEQFQKGAWHE